VGLEEVGFKAIDTYVLEITLQQPVPFFIQVAGFRPTYRPFLEEHGILYGTSLDRTIFIGPFVLTTFEPQFRRVWEKNPHYYNADGVYITRIEDTYNVEAGLLAPVMFRRGDLDFATITADIVDQWMNDPETAHLVNPGRPATVPFIWYYGFNFWPQFGEEYGASQWDLAVNNTAFRRSILWGLDTYQAHLPVDPFAPEVFLQSTIVPEGFATVNGRDFIGFEPLAEFAYHPTWLFEPERALAYRDQAIEELTAQGVTFPIHVYMPYNPAGALGISWGMEVQVVAQQLTALFGPEYLEFTIEASASTNFLAEVRREGNFAFMKLNHGASVAPGDPEAGVFPWYTAPIFNWNHIDRASGEETQRLFAEYTALVDKAVAIPVANEERFMAFAEAEAFFIEHAFAIPYYVTGGGYHVRRYNIFEGYGAGPLESGMEGMKLLAEPLTGEQWRLLYADWQEERRSFSGE
jgi:oligopeptide transport system substrate-binding protein